MNFIHKLEGFDWRNGRSAPTYEAAPIRSKKSEITSDKQCSPLKHRIIKTLKDIVLFFPIVITAHVIEKYLFPMKGRLSPEWHRVIQNNQSFLGKIRTVGASDAYAEEDGFDDKKYFLKSHGGTTAIHYSHLSPKWKKNNVPHDSNQKKLVILFPGNGETLENFHELKKAYMETNTAFLMLDYPNHGRSTGKLNHQSLEQQAELVYQFAIEQLGYQEDQIVVKGTSLGCYSALSLAKSHQKLSALELDAPFSTMEKISRAERLSESKSIFVRWIGKLMKRTIQKYYNFNQMKDLDRLQNFEGKIKIIRRTRDTLTALDAQNILKSSLTNEVIKGIVETQMGQSFSLSTKEERETWMDEFLSDEYLKEETHLSCDDERHRIFDFMKHLVEDKPINISGK